MSRKQDASLPFRKRASCIVSINWFNENMGNSDASERLGFNDKAPQSESIAVLRMQEDVQQAELCSSATSRVPCGPVERGRVPSRGAGSEGTVLLGMKGGANSRWPERSSDSPAPLQKVILKRLEQRLLLRTVSVTVIYIFSPDFPGTEATPSVCLHSPPAPESLRPSCQLVAEALGSATPRAPQRTSEVGTCCQADTG